MDTTTITLIINIAIVALVSSISIGYSIVEKQYRAAAKLAIGSITISTLFTTILLLPNHLQTPIILTLITIQLITTAYLFWPYTKKVELGKWSSIVDERDIMFSRARMKPNTEKFEQYYIRKPELKAIDNKWRALPGLMAPQSRFADPVLFAAADAAFSSVEAFHQLAETKRKAPTKQQLNEQQITNYITKWAKHLGAIECGITTLKPQHWYSHIGRGNDYGKEVDQSHQFAIAFTVEMDRQMMNSAPKAPCVMESATQYLKAGTIATHITEFIRNLGYDARAHIDGNYRVICPLVAVDAGLGEIGRMGLLMTPTLGPRVRIGVITTELPLEQTPTKRDNSITDFCNICKKCAHLCPAQAIETGDRKEIDQSLRWKIDSEKCFTYWCSSGTDCGRCMSVCPYSHPNNLFHNATRWLIKNCPNFRPLAYRIDEWLYRQKPSPSKRWLKLEN